ncbi:MAG: tetratricopeptide repeat protein [Planctomycetota bacterium]|jgi:tetratricopeptide (TPR) repeat protein
MGRLILIALRGVRVGAALGACAIALYTAPVVEAVGPQVEQSGAAEQVAQSQPNDWERVSTALDAGELELAGRLGLDLLRAVGDGGGELALEAQQVAFRLGVSLDKAGLVDLGSEVQVALFEAVPADWSAVNAALTLTRSGRTEQADEILARRLETTPRAAELWSQRGVLWLGAGDENRALGHFGRAVRYGSVNASFSLGRLALFRGDRAAARAAFRPSIDSPSPHAWALRGWAATLLPDPAVPGPRAGDTQR